MSIHLGGASTYPCYILYIVFKWDQTNDIHFSGLWPSVLWRCSLGGRKGIQPVKNEWWGAGMVICLERGADLHMAQLMPLSLTVSCFSKIWIGFTFLLPAHPGSSVQRAIKRVFVCVCVCVCVCVKRVMLFSGIHLVSFDCRYASDEVRHCVCT